MTTELRPPAQADGGQSALARVVPVAGGAASPGPDQNDQQTGARTSLHSITGSPGFQWSPNW